MKVSRHGAATVPFPKSKAGQSPLAQCPAFGSGVVARCRCCRVIAASMGGKHSPSRREDQLTRLAKQPAKETSLGWFFAGRLGGLDWLGCRRLGSPAFGRGSSVLGVRRGLFI